MQHLRPLAARTALAQKSSVLGDPLAAIEPMPGTIRVSGGVDNEWLPLAGRTVGEVRRRIASRYGLDPQASAYLRGQAVGDDVIVRQGEHLSFVRLSGEKGRAGGRP